MSAKVKLAGSEETAANLKAAIAHRTRVAQACAALIVATVGSCTSGREIARYLLK